MPVTLLPTVSIRPVDLPHPRGPVVAVDHLANDLLLVQTPADLVLVHLLPQRPLDRLLQFPVLLVLSRVGQRPARSQLCQAARVLLEEEEELNSGSRCKFEEVVLKL